MTPAQARKFAAVMRKRRIEFGFSMRQLAMLSGLQFATVAGLEGATILAPQPDTLAALAEPLQMSVSDLYMAAGWLPVDELPSLRPYMRAKYRDLDDSAIADLERYADRLIKRHGAAGPRGREDEDPE